MKNITGTIQGNHNTTALIKVLKNAEKQYPVLSKAEEKELIKKNKHDRDKLNQLLFMHNVQMVFNIAKHYKGKTADFDGMVQNGMVGLMEAAKRFDIKKDIKFVTYAYTWVSKYILSEFYMKNKEVDQNSSSLNQTMSYHGKSMDEGGEFEDCVNNYLDPSVFESKSVHDELSANEKDELVEKLMKTVDNDTSLSATDKKVFVDIFYNRERPSDIADKYDITMRNINEIKKKILGKLRTELETSYNIYSYDDVP